MVDFLLGEKGRMSLPCRDCSTVPACSPSSISRNNRRMKINVSLKSICSFMVNPSRPFHLVWPRLMAFRILVSWLGIEPLSSALQSGFLTTGPPGKSPVISTLSRLGRSKARRLVSGRDSSRRDLQPYCVIPRLHVPRSSSLPRMEPYLHQWTQEAPAGLVCC